MATLVDLLSAIGAENIEYQYLTNSMVDIKAKRGESKVTFLTQKITPNDVMSGQGPRGIVVWVDADLFESKLAELRGGAQ